MALELFKPFIYSKLQKNGFANTIKAAKKKVEDRDEKVWDILDEVIQEHPVLLNRAPTLHRLGIQAFEPKLIEGKAIQLHPLVCTAFNADFDGDQMAVHLPLSIEAQIEARVLMMSSNNILSPANGKPIIVPSQDIVLGCYYMTRHRFFAKGEGRIFASAQEARLAYESGIVDLQAQVKCRMNNVMIDTTVGRLLMSEILPENLTFDLINQAMGKKHLAALIDMAYRRCTAKQTVLLADAIKDLGYAQATRAGISIALEDLNISDDQKRNLVESGHAEIAAIQEQAREGMLSTKERYNKVIDKWTQITESVAQSMLEAISKETFIGPNGEKKFGQSFNSVHIMADSGARGGPAQIKQLAGMRGLMAKPSGEIIETPITSNFREGLTVLEYFISAHGARKGLADTALKTANSGYLTRRLVDVAQDAIITEYDCRQSSGKDNELLNAVEMRAVVDGSDIIEKLSDRVLGRVVAEDVYDENTSELLFNANTLVGELEAGLIDSNTVNHIWIRSPLTCETRRGICMLCYGRDLARGRLVNLGEAVGVIAAQSIGEPGTQLTMRTFHIGGAASQQARKNSIVCRTEQGRIQLENAKLIAPTKAPIFTRRGQQTLVAMIDDTEPTFEVQNYKLVANRNARLIIQDANGIEKENHPLGDGYKLDFDDGHAVKAGQRIAHWDPFSNPIFSEVEGVVVFENISVDEGTLKEDRENNNVVRRIAMPVRKNKGRAVKGRKSSKLAVKIKTPKVRICKPVYTKREDQWIVTAGDTIRFEAQDGSIREAVYELPVNAILDTENGALIGAGQAIAKTEIEAVKTKDITGGLPRVVELFEARAKDKSAVLAQIDGRVEEIIGESSKRIIRIVSDDPLEAPEDHLVKGQQIIVREGDYVKAGESLSDGPISPHEILKVSSERAVSEYLVNEIQQVYRLQGVRINDKHIEVIIRQMLRRVRIKDVGDTQFLPDEQVEKWILEEENSRLEEGKRPAVAEPLLLGITKASLATESFISASSFQETTKVLTAAALKGKIDYLHGLKENVIMGRLIPAGTGLRGYSSLNIKRVTQSEDL
jgi:DNA-directed RNA polymerase subunit beta'